MSEYVVKFVNEIKPKTFTIKETNLGITRTFVKIQADKYFDYFSTERDFETYGEKYWIKVIDSNLLIYNETKTKQFKVADVTTSTAIADGDNKETQTAYYFKITEYNSNTENHCYAYENHNFGTWLGAEQSKQLNNNYKLEVDESYHLVIKKSSAPDRLLYETLESTGTGITTDDTIRTCTTKEDMINFSIATNTFTYKKIQHDTGKLSTFADWINEVHPQIATEELKIYQGTVHLASDFRNTIQSTGKNVTPETVLQNNENYTIYDPNEILHFSIQLLKEGYGIEEYAWKYPAVYKDGVWTRDTTWTTWLDTVQPTYSAYPIRYNASESKIWILNNENYYCIVEPIIEDQKAYEINDCYVTLTIKDEITGHENEYADILNTSTFADFCGSQPHFETITGEQYYIRILDTSYVGVEDNEDDNYIKNSNNKYISPEELVKDNLKCTARVVKTIRPKIKNTSGHEEHYQIRTYNTGYNWQNFVNANFAFDELPIKVNTSTNEIYCYNNTYRLLQYDGITAVATDLVGSNTYTVKDVPKISFTIIDRLTGIKKAFRAQIDYTFEMWLNDSTFSKKFIMDDSSEVADVVANFSAYVVLSLSNGLQYNIVNGAGAAVTTSQKIIANANYCVSSGTGYKMYIDAQQWDLPVEITTPWTLWDWYNYLIDRGFTKVMVNRDSASLHHKITMDEEADPIRIDDSYEYKFKNSAEVIQYPYDEISNTSYYHISKD